MTEHYNGDEQDVEILKSFILFIETQIPENTEHARISLSDFNIINSNAQKYLKSINNDKFNYNSFTCGVAFGMRMMTAPENEV